MGQRVYFVLVVLLDIYSAVVLKRIIKHYISYLCNELFLKVYKTPYENLQCK